MCVLHSPLRVRENVPLAREASPLTKDAIAAFGFKDWAFYHLLGELARGRAAHKNFMAHCFYHFKNLKLLFLDEH